MTAGPYGESWRVRVDRYGEAWVGVYYGKFSPGNMQGSFLLNRDDVDALAKLAEDNGFFKLPRRLATAGVLPVHALDLRLSVMVDGKGHSVDIYHPEGVVDRTQVAAFIAVWDKLFRLLPLRPDERAMSRIPEHVKAE